MNPFSKGLKLSVAAAAVPRASKAETAFVRQFGGAVRTVSYSGREDLVGLKVLGERKGFRVEQTGTGRRLRLLKVLKNNVIVTSDCRALNVCAQFKLKNINISSLIE